MLGRAIQDDPLFRYLFPDPAERPRLAVADATPVVRAAQMYGEVWVTDDLSAAACWRRPGDREATPEQRAASGLAALPGVLGADAWARLAAVFTYIDPRLAALGLPEHWYLEFVGVAPERHGAGLGAAVLAPVLARADADGVACYLETFAAGNVPFYERLGFQVVEAAVEPSSGLAYWLCLRHPAPPNAGRAAG